MLCSRPNVDIAPQRTVPPASPAPHPCQALLCPCPWGLARSGHFVPDAIIPHVAFWVRLLSLGMMSSGPSTWYQVLRSFSWPSISTCVTVSISQTPSRPESGLDVVSGPLASLSPQKCCRAVSCRRLEVHAARTEVCALRRRSAGARQTEGRETPMKRSAGTRSGTQARCWRPCRNGLFLEGVMEASECARFERGPVWRKKRVLGRGVGAGPGHRRSWAFLRHRKAVS